MFAAAQAAMTDKEIAEVPAEDTTYEPEQMPFTDIPADACCAEAVRWAVEKGITSGTSQTTFSPDAECTRAQIVTFLYRCLGDEE